jgi:hypothetical protein
MVSPCLVTAPKPCGIEQCVLTFSPLNHPAQFVSELKYVASPLMKANCRKQAKSHTDIAGSALQYEPVMYVFQPYRKQINISETAFTFVAACFLVFDNAGLLVLDAVSLPEAC